MKQKIKHIERQLKNLFNFDSTELFGDKTNEIVATIYILMLANAFKDTVEDIPILTIDEVRESFERAQFPLNTMIKMQSDLRKNGHLTAEQQDELIEYITAEYNSTQKEIIK